VKLYSYFRSSAAYRVRIALNLKGLPYETTSIHLVKEGGLNKRPEYRAVNPQMRVPALVAPNGEVLIQSLAIIEYLNETHPEPPLLAREAEPIVRAHARALAQIVACDIHPLNNIGPLRYLKNEMHQEQSAIDAWYHHWVRSGFEAIEALIAPAPYACGGTVTLADVCLVPQVYNAQRAGIDLTPFPTIRRIYEECNKVEAFDRARPERQPDAS
jgi:maleylpyruvate isomerase